MDNTINKSLMKKSCILELVVYKIKPEATEKYKTDTIDFFRKLIKAFDGFISYEFFQSYRDNEIFMDLVSWNTIENAELAAKKVKEIQKGIEFKDYIESFEKVEVFNHFKFIDNWKN